MSIDFALTLIALLLSFWALTWARRAATAAERIAVAAEKNALAAERSAMAARRAADAAEYSAVTARTSGGNGSAATVDDAVHSRGARIDAIVKELIQTWTRDASAWPLVESNTGLADDEVEEMIRKAFHLMGRTEGEAKQHAVAVLNLRHDQKRQLSL